MSTRLVGRWIRDPLPSAKAPPQPDPDMDYVLLRCPCGGRGFRVTGWPRLGTGPGGLFWRSLSRVFREARLPGQDGEPRESPFWLPIHLECERCGRADPILSAPDVPGRLPPEQEVLPRESVRCRICRRSAMEVAVGLSGFETAREATSEEVGQGAAEVVTRCQACFRDVRLAWGDARPSPQQVRLDRLYGRR